MVVPVLWELFIAKQSKTTRGACVGGVQFLF